MLPWHADRFLFCPGVHCTMEAWSTREQLPQPKTWRRLERGYNQVCGRSNRILGFLGSPLEWLVQILLRGCQISSIDRSIGRFGLSRSRDHYSNMHMCRRRNAKRSTIYICIGFGKGGLSGPRHINWVYSSLDQVFKGYALKRRIYKIWLWGCRRSPESRIHGTVPLQAPSTLRHRKEPEAKENTAATFNRNMAFDWWLWLALTVAAVVDSIDSILQTPLPGPSFLEHLLPWVPKLPSLLLVGRFLAQHRVCPLLLLDSWLKNA